MPVSLAVRLIAWGWFGAALAAGHFLVLRRLPPLALPALGVFLAAVAAYACLRIGPLRRWLDTFDPRVFVLLHVSRLIGFYLLYLFQRGELSRSFALSTGIVDIVVGTMALPVVFAPLDDSARRRALAIWNVVGFIGLLVMLVTFARLESTAPWQLRQFTALPLSLLPTFLSPLLLASHIVLFRRLREP